MKATIDLNRPSKDQLLAIDGVDSRIPAHRRVQCPFNFIAGIASIWPVPAHALGSLPRAVRVERDPPAEERPKQARSDFKLRSPAFEDGGEIPRRFTCDGENLSPPLVWSGAPAETRSFALLVEDPDAPGGVFRHWVLYDIAAERTCLPEGTTHGTPVERLEVGFNDFGVPRYGGPCPLQGHGAHLVFRLAALDVPASDVPRQPSARDIWDAVRPRSIAEAVLTGRYSR